MSQLTFIKLYLSLVLFLPGFLTQSIPTYSICPTRTITLPDPRGSYYIEHNTNNSVSNETLCKLTLNATIIVGSFVVMTGVSSYRCITSEITVENQKLCISPGEYWAWRVETIKQCDLVITTTASQSDFTIMSYYSVYECSRLSRSIENSSLSGVVSSFPPGHRIILRECETSLEDLPSGATLRFEPLYLRASDRYRYFRVIGQTTKIVRAARSVVYINVPDTGIITISYVPDRSSSIGQFAWQYSVVRCGDIPEIENATHTPVHTPYLPGFTVQYSCGDNFKFKNKLYITCEERIQGEAVWSDDVMCIPVPWCLEQSKNISRTNQTVTSVNRTVSYECEQGFESTYGPNVTVTCSTTDEDIQPWRWNYTNLEQIFQCNPVQCSVHTISVVRNGELIGKTTFYDYTDTVTYECDAGFEKNTTKPIICESDRSWSAVPRCVRVSCIKPQLMNAQILGRKDSDIETYAYEDIVIVRCREGYTLLDRSNTNNEVLTCSSSGRWLSFNDDAIQSEVTCNFAEDKETGRVMSRSEENLATTILSAVLGVICIIHIIVVGVLVRIYRVTRTDLKKRMAMMGRSENSKIIGGNRPSGTSQNVTPRDEYENVCVEPPEIEISENSKIQALGSGYEQMTKGNAGEKTYENAAYTTDQSEDHEYEKLDQ